MYEVIRIARRMLGALGPGHFGLIHRIGHRGQCTRHAGSQPAHVQVPFLDDGLGSAVSIAAS